MANAGFLGTTYIPAATTGDVIIYTAPLNVAYSDIKICLYSAFSSSGNESIMVLIDGKPVMFGAETFMARLVPYTWIPGTVIRVPSGKTVVLRMTYQTVFREMFVRISGLEHERNTADEQYVYWGSATARNVSTTVIAGAVTPTYTVPANCKVAIARVRTMVENDRTSNYVVLGRKVPFARTVNLSGTAVPFAHNRAYDFAGKAVFLYPGETMALGGGTPTEGTWMGASADITEQY